MQVQLRVLNQVLQGHCHVDYERILFVFFLVQLQLALVKQDRLIHDYSWDDTIGVLRLGRIEF